jgi:hypothetical protein
MYYTANHKRLLFHTISFEIIKNQNSQKRDFNKNNKIQRTTSQKERNPTQEEAKQL